MTGSVTTPNLGIRGSEHFLRGRRRYWAGAHVGVTTPGTNWVGFGSLVYTLRQCPCEGHATPHPRLCTCFRTQGGRGLQVGGSVVGGRGRNFPTTAPQAVCFCGTRGLGVTRTVTGSRRGRRGPVALSRELAD